MGMASCPGKPGHNQDGEAVGQRWIPAPDVRTARRNPPLQCWERGVTGTSGRRAPNLSTAPLILTVRRWRYLRARRLPAARRLHRGYFVAGAGAVVAGAFCTVVGGAVLVVVVVVPLGLVVLSVVSQPASMTATNSKAVDSVSITLLMIFPLRWIIGLNSALMSGRVRRTNVHQLAITDPQKTCRRGIFVGYPRKIKSELWRIARLTPAGFEGEDLPAEFWASCGGKCLYHQSYTNPL